MFKREKVKILLTITVILILLVGTSLFISRKTEEEPSPPTTENQRVPEQPAKSRTEEETKTENKTATLEISGVIYQAEIVENASVYDFMDKLRSEGKIQFKDTTYIGMGKFIEEINGVRGDGTRYWIYYVNGKKAQVGVSNYTINPGDVVSWKYEKDTN